MPKVPVAQNQIQTRSANVDTMQVGQLSSGISGNNIMEASSRLTDNMTKAGTVFAEYAIKQKQIESQKVALEKSTSAMGEIDNLLYDPGKDDDGRPKGILNRKLGQVGADSVVEYDKGVNAIVSKYSEGLDDATIAHLQNTLGTHARTLRDNVAKHQVTEMNGDLENKYQSNMKLQVGNAANAQNDEALSSLIGSSHSTIESTLKAKGMDSASIQLEQQKTTDQMIKTNIFSKLEKDPDAAKRTLENFKEHASPEFYQETTKAIDGKRFENLRTGLYSNTFSKMKLSDGEPDIPRIEKAIEASNFPGNQKEELRSYMKARAMEDSQSFHRQEKDVINQFSNEIINGKKQGMTLDDALKATGKYGGDAVDNKTREDIAKKLYTDPSAKSDPDTVLSLYENIKTGKSSKAEIKQAFADNKLNAHDYVSITKEHLSEKLGETKKEDTLAFDRVKLLADQNFSDKDKKNQFLYAIKSTSQGKTPDEIWDNANKQLSGVEGTGFLGMFKDKQYQTTLKQQDANNAAWGTVKESIGHDEVKAIGRGALLKGASSWGLSDIDNFAKTFGGMDQIKKGTPAGNAINSLTKKGQLVTPQNVKAVLAVHPDGNY